MSPAFVDEEERLAALQRYDLLDTLPEQVYDDLARLAAHVCQTPIALVSLIDTDRQWFKARVGLDTQETSIEHSFCAHAVAAGEVLVVPNATLDARFRDNPLVTGPPADRDRVVQVLINLLSNAIKASPPGAVVEAFVGPAAEGRIRMEVRDEGPGIPGTEMRRIFEKFQQIEQDDGRRRGGTGLGLTISKAIVEQHGGSIGVESEPGRGSTFWFDLPVCPPGAELH